MDPTVTEAWRRTRELAEKAGRVKASENLAEAWRELYGQHPDPSASYSAAVKAVENAALDVVFPNRQPGQLKTIHAASRELRKHPGRWRFVLREAETVPVGQGSTEVVTTMLDRFLRGETDRHADDENRASEPAEAAAALHLAVVLVQWFVTGAVQPKDSA
ncbi:MULTISPECIES: hypothetical protein [Prauserella salsuginis group]|uniref:SAV-6107-like HEPN domain-containing protein n=1 Tax=Prauserella salsuginis TaxID=387889 RepID=A0ABW6GBM6_9PSEU|nr:MULTISPECIES: hypothetical protein [Prauserella salsuginis group]MCR3721887.1 hypothetical protein [Prauserella flava]MCR3735892.1 hypothetical protein [Prauserella salsuginis]